MLLVSWNLPPMSEFTTLESSRTTRITFLEKRPAEPNQLEQRLCPLPPPPPDSFIKCLKCFKKKNNQEEDAQTDADQMIL